MEHGNILTFLDYDWHVRSAWWYGKEDAQVPFELDKNKLPLPYFDVDDWATEVVGAVRAQVGGDVVCHYMHIDPHGNAIFSGPGWSVRYIAKGERHDNGRLKTKARASDFGQSSHV